MVLRSLATHSLLVFAKKGREIDAAAEYNTTLTTANTDFWKIVICSNNITVFSRLAITYY